MTNSSAIGKLTWCLLLSLAGQALTGLAAEIPKTSPRMLVYIGTYTGPKSKGIYLCQLDSATGALTSLGLAGEITSPSFLALHPNHRFLYAANEVSSFAGQRTGAVSAFAIDPQTGKLTLLNQASSGGGGPCHLVVDGSGRCVLVANYGGGSVAALKIKADGRVSEPATVIQHQGSSVNRQRQERPHTHSVNLDAANRFAFVADLGLDKILVYRFDADQGSLTPAQNPWVALAPGDGPRHFTFNPPSPFAYVINELHSTITAFAYDAESGRLTQVQTVSTLPAGFTGENSTAEVRAHPSGRFLYGSNRGHDSLAVFAIEAGTGKLTLVQHVATQGKNPRNFAIDPSGKFLLAANQDSDSVVVFRIDPDAGKLSPTGSQVSVGTPVCVRYLSLD